MDDDDDEKEGLLAAIPASVKQAVSIAEQYVREHPESAVIVKRGEKVLCRLHPARQEAA